MARTTKASLERARCKAVETEERYSAIRELHHGLEWLSATAAEVPLDGLELAEERGLLVVPYRRGVRWDRVRTIWRERCRKRRIPFVAVYLRPDGYGQIEWDLDTQYPFHPCEESLAAGLGTSEGREARSEPLWRDMEAVYCRMELNAEVSRQFSRKLRTDLLSCGGWYGGSANFAAEYREVVSVILHHVLGTGVEARQQAPAETGLDEDEEAALGMRKPRK